jgi:hypothetical protein
MPSSPIRSLALRVHNVAWCAAVVAAMSKSVTGVSVSARPPRSICATEGRRVSQRIDQHVDRLHVSIHDIGQLFNPEPPGPACVDSSSNAR